MLDSYCKVLLYSENEILKYFIEMGYCYARLFMDTLCVNPSNHVRQKQIARIYYFSIT